LVLIYGRGGGGDSGPFQRKTNVGHWDIKHQKKKKTRKTKAGLEEKKEEEGESCWGGGGGGGGGGEIGQSD